MICGERDPFVDDTVIFAGKIREAKRAKRALAATRSQGKSAKFGEGLRMSTSRSSESEVPDHILRETDEDWVQMRIIEGWGHGFMQMASLMREVDSVLTEMADWIDESFQKAMEKDKDIHDVAAAKASFQPDVPPLLSPVDHLPPPAFTHVKPARSYKSPASHTGGADLGAPVPSAQQDDQEEGVIAFTPKSKKKTPPASKFIPVVRRPSKDNLDLHRSDSAPRFDIDETGSSGEAMDIETPPLGQKSLPGFDPIPKGSGAFAFFGSNRPGHKAVPKVIPPPAPGPVPLYGSSTISRRPSNSSTTATKPQNSLVAAAVAGARAASPALAAAGLAPQSIGNVSEAELMRRRRMEAVFGIGDVDSAVASDEEDQVED